MTALAAALLVATAVLAVADWVAVGTGRTALEYVAKPGTMVALIGACLSLDGVDGTARTWFVVALVLSLAGDVFLMLPRDLFVPGLASFLLGHLAYVAGLLQGGTSGAGLAVAAALVAVALPVLGRRIVGAVRSGPEPALLGPVVAYVAVISAMVLAAGASGEAVALAGAVSFYGSDATIAWNRFVQPLAWAPVAIMVSYHAAQVAIVLSLL